MYKHLCRMGVLTSNRRIESIHSVFLCRERYELNSMFRNKHALIRTARIDQNPILYDALNGNRSIVKVLSGARILIRTLISGSAGGLACVVVVAVVGKLSIGHGAGELSIPPRLLRLIEVGRVLAKCICVVFLRGAICKYNSEAQLRDASLAVIGRRHVRRNLRIRSKQLDEREADWHTAIGNLRVPRSEVFCESLSSGKTPNSGTVLWSNGKKEVLAENSRILASRRATTTITFEEGILVVIES